ncbi:MAG: site-specific integrase [Acidobacteria bacterium]|nr:site-specific integrase [Acidobacteriota bacterium]
MTVKEIEKFRDTRLSEITKRGSKRNGNSVCREMAMLSKVFDLAIKKDYCEENPVGKVEWPHQPNRRERFITEEEESKIFKSLSGRYERLRPVFLLALYSGLRRGEIFALQWRDVDFEKKNLRLRAETTKTSKGRNVPLIEPAFSILAKLKKSVDGEPHEKVFPFGASRACALFREILDHLGLIDVGLHVLRHTFATRGMRAGIHPLVMKDILGHSTIDMTAYYSHTGREDLLREAKKLEKSV